jgi:hypothetical protein
MCGRRVRFGARIIVTTIIVIVVIIAGVIGIFQFSPLRPGSLERKQRDISSAIDALEKR